MDTITIKQELLAAVKDGDLACVQKLLDDGGNINAIYPNGRTLLIAACESQREEVVDFLLQNGANIDQRDFYDHTPLMYAADKGYIPITVLLINAGADVNIKNKQGLTALMYAVYKDHAEIASSLLAAGADINARDRKNHTALDYSFFKKNNVCRDLLERLGAERQYSKPNRRLNYSWLQLMSSLSLDTSVFTETGAGSWKRITRFLFPDFTMDEFTELKNSPKWTRDSIFGTLALIVPFLFIFTFLFFLLSILPDLQGYALEYVFIPLGRFVAIVVVWMIIKIFPSFWKIFSLGFDILREPLRKPKSAKITKIRQTPSIDSGNDLSFISMLVGVGAKELSSIHLTYFRRQSIRVKTLILFNRILSIIIASSILVFVFLPCVLPFWLWVVFRLEYLLRRHRLQLIQRDRDQIAGEISNLLNVDEYNKDKLPVEFGLYLRAFMTTDKLHLKGFDLETMLAYSIAPTLPLIALGKPGEHLGSGRIQTTDDHWQEEILRLMDTARLILIIPSHRAGTLWEITTLRERGYFEKTIFIMPPELEFHGGKYSIDWRKTVIAAREVGVEFPYHISSGAFFRLNGNGEFEDYAPFVPDEFMQEFDPIENKEATETGSLYFNSLYLNLFEADHVNSGDHMGSRSASQGNHHGDRHGGQHDGHHDDGDHDGSRVGSHGGHHNFGHIGSHEGSHGVHHDGGHEGSHGGDHGGRDAG